MIVVEIGCFWWYINGEVRKVLTDERYRLILESLERESFVKLQDLVDITESSESTIRRDLKKLEEEEKLVRVHGGARRIHHLVGEDMMEEKSFKHIDEKRDIAKLAASLIRDKELVYLDAGSTTYEMIPFLKGREITVITNGIPHASLLTDLGITTIQIGGKIKQRTKAVIGPEAHWQIQNYHFSKAFLGMNGIDVGYGYTTPDVEEAAIKQLVMAKSGRSFILADASKINTVTFAKVADIEDATVITTALSKELKALLEEQTTVMEVE